MSMATVFDEEIKIIRRFLKSRAPGIRVYKGRGEARGWIVIKSHRDHAPFDVGEALALEAIGIYRYTPDNINCVMIRPELIRYYVKRAVSLLGIKMPALLEKAYAEEDRELRLQVEHRRGMMSGFEFLSDFCL
jgi:hypothetical protein